MIRGRYGATTGAPYVEAVISFPRFNVRGTVSFLIDTGADSTTLPPEAIQRLKIDYALFRDVEPASGIGGTENLFVEPADVFLHDPERNEIYKFSVRATILPFTAQYVSYPALLGRDVLNRCRLVCDPLANGVEIEVRTPDETISL